MDRRDMLKIAGSAIAGASIFGSSAFASNRESAEPNKVPRNRIPLQTSEAFIHLRRTGSDIFEK